MDSLFTRFARSVSRWPERPAVSFGEREWTYTQLAADALRVGRALAKVSPSQASLAQPARGEAPLAGVFGSQSYEAYAGVLGVLGRGLGYVPLNPVFPAITLHQMIETSGLDAAIVAPEALPQLDALLASAPRRLGLVLPAGVGAQSYRARHTRHAFVALDEIDGIDDVHGEPAASDDGAAPALAGAARRPPALSDPLPSPAPESAAVILFTSGSTGAPKGVGLSNRALEHYFDFVCARYALTEQDRGSQFCPLSFDMSMLELFLSWSAGACVCAPAPGQTITLGRYIEDQRLTVWLSTPSAIALVRRQNDLQPGSYPRLRWGLFVGEALPLELARDFQVAAPNATIENLYGPTELTLTCTFYRYDPERSPRESEAGGVPIGHPNPGLTALVCDEQLREVPPGEIGELLIAGPQLALGYWNDPERTRRSFVVPPERSENHYRTGDFVRRPHGDEPLNYLGRGDAQVQVHGVRVELAEVEAAVRAESGCDSVAVGWPVTESGVDGIMLFLIGDKSGWPRLRKALHKRLPAYAVPKRAIFVDSFPTTSSGKTDRRALRLRLEATARPASEAATETVETATPGARTSTTNADA